MSNQISGGPIKNFKQGWAKFVFGGAKAHYWIEDEDTMPPKISTDGRVRYYRSQCGLLNATNNRFPPLEAGSWARCKRCEAQRQRSPS